MQGIGFDNLGLCILRFDDLVDKGQGQTSVFSSS
jgi:hypothetical protein